MSASASPQHSGTLAPAEIEPKPEGAPSSFNPYRAHRSLLSPQRVRELSILRPVVSVRDTALCWLTILLAWALAAWSFAHPQHLWWALPVAIMTIGARYYALFIIGHDGMHRRIFNSGPRSELFTDLFLIGPIGMVCAVNARNHLDHHQFLATDADPDLHKHACFNKSSRFEYLLFLTGLASVVQVLVNLFLRPLSSPAKPGARAASYSLRDSVIILSWQLLLFLTLTSLVAVARAPGAPIAPLSILARAWFAYPLLWLLPVYLFAYLPNLIRSFVEHSHPERDDLADRHRLISFLSNPIERFFLSPMNMNYHIAHHLWPSIPYYNLPVADAELRAASTSTDLSWRRSYLGYLWRYFVALPLAECRASRHRTRRV